MTKNFFICYGLWCSLGAYRGVQLYNTYFNYEYKYYLKHPEENKPIYSYTECIGKSIDSLYYYANPLTIPVYAIIELYEVKEEIRRLIKKI